MIMLTSGIIFYWFSWVLWIVITFFMEKGKKRTWLACWLLLSICCSNSYVTMAGFQLSITLLLLIIGSLLLLVQEPRLMYHLFSSFTITIGYASMLLWEVNAPVWIIFSRIITISFLLGIMTILLAKDFYSQLAICVFGVSFGEIIYHFILSSYGFHLTAGDFVFLDCLLSVVIILVTLKLLGLAKSKLVASFHVYKHILRHKVLKS